MSDLVHTVVAGECVSSLAVRYGLGWQDVWDHAENADLKRLRKEPNILHEGDKVYIPEYDDGAESIATEKEHRFRVTNTPAVLRVRMLKAGAPIKNTEYAITIDGEQRTGKTNGDGDIEEPIAPDAALAQVKLKGMVDVFDLHLGCLAPVAEIKGVQQRLTNLGFHPGPSDGIMGRRTVLALKGYQASKGLTRSGEADDATRRTLAEDHDGV